MHVAYGRGSVLLRQNDEIPKRTGRFLVVFFPTDSALYSIAFETHTKMAEPIKMPFQMMNGLGPTNSVLHAVTIPEGKTVLEKNMCPTSLTPYELWIELVHLNRSMQRRAYDMGRRLTARVELWTSLLSAANERG